MRHTQRLLCVAGCALAMVFLTGCASPHLRGTPYYTTEYKPTHEKSEDRIPLWPLVYYRSPTLSVLWPIFEKSDEYVALRPLASAYGLDRPRRLYSLLWPLGVFDRVEEQNRFFPFFWGKGYAVGFPLYWHFDHPLSAAGGTDALIPLWWYSSDRAGVSANLLWPFLQVKRRTDGQGWRVWPLIGMYSGYGDSYYRFLAWPLAHQWNYNGNSKGHAVLPLYLRVGDAKEGGFFSIPYSTYSDLNHVWHFVPPLLYHGRDREGTKTLTPLVSWGGRHDGGRSWQLVLPVYYTSREGDRRVVATLVGGMRRDAQGLGWVVVPLFSGGSRDAEGHSTWLLGPLAHFGRNAEGTSQHVAPFYYASSNATGRTFVSIPWSSGSDRNGFAWQLLPPLWLRLSSPEGQRTFTPLYACGGTSDGKTNWQAVLPLWYRGEDPDGKLVATLLGGWRTDADGKSWLIWPLLSGGGRRRDGHELWVLAPFYHARRDRAGLSQHLLPFFWWNAHDRTLISLLAARWSNPSAGTRTTVIPPLLTAHTSTPRSESLWTAGGLAHFSWGETPGSSHIIPLYYRDTNAFISLPWAQWVGHDRATNTVVAPALSWLNEDHDRSDLWSLGPLAHFSWGAQAGPSHVVPLFYRNPRTDTFISLPYARWTAGTAERDLFPPLLSWYTRDRGQRQLDALLGLFSETWGEGRHEGYLFPLYFHDKLNKVYTPLLGWNRDADNGFFYPLTPLLGIRTGTHSGGWIQPFWSRDYDPVTQTASGNVLWGAYTVGRERADSMLFPFYGYRNSGPEDVARSAVTQSGSYGKRFWCLPACWYRNTVDVLPAGDTHGRPRGNPARSAVRDHGFLPFWTFTHRSLPDATEDTYGTFLMLYDYQTTRRPASTDKQLPVDYVRRRLLWKFCDYERSDDNVTLDLFPGITYDRTQEGLRKWAFLWRVFRYETGPDGRKLDLLFVPLLRSPAGRPTETNTGS